MKAHVRLLPHAVSIVSPTKHADDCRGDDGFVPFHNMPEGIAVAVSREREKRDARESILPWTT